MSCVERVYLLPDDLKPQVMSYVTHRTRDTSEPFFDFSDDDFADHDDLFSVHYNTTYGA